jgi:hypothetical protein
MYTRRCSFTAAAPAAVSVGSHADAGPYDVKDRTRNRFAHNTLAVLSALALIVLPSAALAGPLAPGNFVNLIGTTSAVRPELVGVVLQDTIRPFSVDHGGGNFTTGMIQDRVVRETASGTLDFYYKISNDVSSAGSVDFVTRNSFIGFGADVDFRTDGVGTIGPDQASRNAAGDEVLFDFFSTNLLFPGAQSFSFFVKTDATDFDENGTGSLAFSSNLGGGTFDFDTFQPIMKPGTRQGDFNRNGVVDAADYIVWRKGLGTTYSQTDYDMWRANFGAAAIGSGATAGLSSSVNAAVPEPASIALLLTGFAAMTLNVALRQRLRLPNL